MYFENSWETVLPFYANPIESVLVNIWGITNKPLRKLQGEYNSDELFQKVSEGWNNLEEYHIGPGTSVWMPIQWRLRRSLFDLSQGEFFRASCPAVIGNWSI